MTPEDIQYYDELFDTFATPGWKHIIEKWQDVKAAKDTIKGITTNRELGQAQGAIQILDWMLEFEQMHKDEYDRAGDE